VTLVFTRRRLPHRVTTDDHGRYRILLAPGFYTVRVTGFRLVKPLRVTVERGRMTSVNFSIDTGIR
jgi:hypothetical protein